jgi:trimeric autotransporter adhesin
MDMVTQVTTNTASRSQAATQNQTQPTDATVQAWLAALQRAKADANDKTVLNGNGSNGASQPLPNVKGVSFTEDLAVPPPVLPKPQPQTPPAPGSPLAEAETLSQNWDKWGMHNGVDFNNPPSSLPQDAKDTLKFFANNPTLFSAIVQDAGGKPGDVMTKSALDHYISDAKSDAALAQKSVPSGTPNNEPPGNSVISNVQALVANWHTWGLHQGISFANPPADLPADAKAAMQFVASDPTLVAAMSNGTGVVTENDAANFLKSASSDATAGAKAVSDWTAKNPNAGQQSQQLVNSAGLILSNITLISGGSGNLTPTALANFASANSSNTHIDPSLVQAAQLWSQPGMFAMLDMAGDDIATNQPDQIANTNNISSWISKGAPTSDVDFANTLNQAALDNTVAGIDTSKLTGDVLANPQNYSGAQKAAVMVQLSNLQLKLAVGNKEGYWDPGMSQLAEESANINPNFNKVQNSVQGAIDQLAQDPDVQAYIAETKPGALQQIVNSDPNIQSAVYNFYGNSFLTGQALNDDLNAKDSNGKQVAPVTGLETFMQQASFYDEAMGQNGKSLGIMNPQANGGPSLVQQVVQQSGQEQSLQKVYMDQVVNGNLLSNEIAKGTDLGSAISDYSQAAAAFATALDPTFVQQNAGTMQQNFLNNVTDAIFNSATSTDLAAAFGDSKGNFDPNNATQVLQQMQQQDPALFKTSDGQTLAPDKIVSEAKQMYDLVRNGIKVQDAFSKVMDSVSAPSGPATDAYKAGTLHMLSALFGGGVLAAKAAEGAGSPTADASIAATAAQMVGTLTEGVAKWGGSVSQSLWNQPGADDPGVPASVKNTLKNIESQGKVLGGLGGAISGALSIVSGVADLKDGNVAAGALNIGTGTAGALAGVAGATEGGAALLSNAGLIESSIADAVAAGSSALGLFGTVVGVLGTLGFEIYQIVKAAENNSKFTGQVLPELQQYGLTGGPLQPSDLGPAQPNIPHHY